MSDELRSPKALDGRSLRSDEKNLLMTLLADKLDSKSLEELLSDCCVADMQDGGMGSVRFLSHNNDKKNFGKTIVNAEYLDEDGVEASITVNVDQNGEVYELDFWKVDFSPLRRYPTPTEVRISS